MLALGLMSGTSLDGVDAVIIETNGDWFIAPNFPNNYYIPYPDDVKQSLLSLCSGDNLSSFHQVQIKITEIHIEAVNKLLNQANLKPEQISVIGFHGQTILHNPKLGFTWQIGDGSLLCEKTKITVVDQFRSRDVAAGGQGAPLIPIYHLAIAKNFINASHQAICGKLKTNNSVCFLNVGGVSNITFINLNGYKEGIFDYNQMIAFDTGPGNALLDDWIREHSNLQYDDDGKISVGGSADISLIDQWLANEYFTLSPPKSLDRNTFKSVKEQIKKLSFEDGAATLLQFTVKSIKKSIDFLPVAPAVWLVCGGGRKNSTLMNALKNEFNTSIVDSVDSIGLNGDMIEAEGFAFMAARSLLKLPISFPTTTGCHSPITGGSIHYYS